MNFEIIEKVKKMALSMQRHTWEQGCLAEAFLELGDEEQTILLALEAVLRQKEDGRVAVVSKELGITDPCSIGTAIKFAFEKTGDSIFKDANLKLLDWALNKAPRSKDGIVYHILGMKEIWADSIYMLAPYLAEMGMYEESLKQIDGYLKYLYLPNERLIAHKWDFESNTFSRSSLWAEGNGWAIAGMTRVISLLPKVYKSERNRLISITITLIDSSIGYMRDDGFFHDVMNDSGTCVENGLSQLLSYSIYIGVLNGYLEEKYIFYAEKMYSAVEKKIDQYGLVLDVCSAKTNFKVPGPNAEGQAFFILMYSARKKWLDSIN